MINKLQQTITPEQRANVIILRSCMNDDGSFSTPTPEKIMKNIGEQINFIENDDNVCDSFVSQNQCKTLVNASIKPQDVKHGIATITEIVGMLTALDASMKSLLGYSVKDLIQHFANKNDKCNDQKQSEEQFNVAA